MTRRPLPDAWSDASRAILPGTLLIVAALIHETRPFVLAGLVLGTAIAIQRDAPVRWPWAATLPVAVSLAFGLLGSPDLEVDPADCASPASPVALWRLGEASCSGRPSGCGRCARHGHRMAGRAAVRRRPLAGGRWLGRCGLLSGQMAGRSSVR
jgi:hypothetical protein